MHLETTKPRINSCVILIADIMIRSEMPRESSSGSVDTKVIRLTPYQEAVLQQQFNRWPKNPQKGDIVLLAAETGLSEEDVLVNFFHLIRTNIMNFEKIDFILLSLVRFLYDLTLKASPGCLKTKFFPFLAWTFFTRNSSHFASYLIFLFLR